MSDKGEQGPRSALPGEFSGIDDISRRLRELLRTVSEVSVQDVPTVNDGAIEAARRTWRLRRDRETVFGGGIFGDPAWDILLFLFIAHAEGRRATPSSIARAVALPEPAVLRWLAALAQSGLVQGREGLAAAADESKLGLTDRGLLSMCDYFDRVAAGEGAAAA